MPVMNRHTDREYLDEDAVSITRPGPWGNPFVIGRDGDRTEVIEKYKQWLWGELEAKRVTLPSLAALCGKQLVCVCSPRPCHGDVLLAASEWAADLIKESGK